MATAEFGLAGSLSGLTAVATNKPGDEDDPDGLQPIAAGHLRTPAKAGDFTQAVRDQQRAIKLLTPATEDQRPALEMRLELYKARKPLPRE